MPDLPLNEHPAHAILTNFDVVSLRGCAKEILGPVLEALEASRAQGAIVVAPASEGDVKTANMNDAPEPRPPAAGAGVGIPEVPELAARTAAATGDFNGAWLLTEGEGLLKIEGAEWRATPTKVLVPCRPAAGQANTR